MANPWLPPYLGSWEDLIRSLLHDPFLGSPSNRGKVILQTHPTDLAQAEPTPIPWRRFGPQPDPWSPAVAFLVSTISLKEVADRLPKGALQSAFQQRIEATINEVVDDICPPWPWPGPPPWAQLVVGELTAVANSLTEGRLRNEILNVSAQIVEKAYGSSGVGNPG